jgi:prophage antirepressor-like protein
MKVVNEAMKATSTKLQLAVFKFKEYSVRSVLKDGLVWFVAMDVCKALGLENTTKALLALEDDEKALTKIQGIPGKGDVNIINESGLYNLIFSSYKPEAREFRRWVTHEILPAIRKTGYYQASACETPEIEQQAPAQHFRLPEKGIWTIIVEEDHSFRIHPEHFDAINHMFHMQDSAVLAYAIKMIESLWERHCLENQSKGENATPTELKMEKIIRQAVDLATAHLPYRQTINAS